MTSKCKFCGQEVPEGRQFCSMSCRNKEIARGMRARTGMQICLQCGKEFYRHPSDIKRGSVKYCSRPCANVYIKEHGRPDKKVVSKVCKNCGKDFTIPECWLKKFKNAGQFCSRDCYNETQRTRGGAFGGAKKATRGKGNGVYTDSHGYVHEYDPVRHKFVRQHRLVMERMLGRPLEKWEKVHHKLGKRHENEPENLELLIGAHFAGIRIRDFYAKDLERLALENFKLKHELQGLRQQP